MVNESESPLPVYPSKISRYQSDPHLDLDMTRVQIMDDNSSSICVATSANPQVPPNNAKGVNRI